MVEPNETSPPVPPLAESRFFCFLGQYRRFLILSGMVPNARAARLCETWMNEAGLAWFQEVWYFPMTELSVSEQRLFSQRFRGHIVGIGGSGKPIVTIFGYSTRQPLDSTEPAEIQEAYVRVRRLISGEMRRFRSEWFWNQPWVGVASNFVVPLFPQPPCYSLPCSTRGVPCLACPGFRCRQPK